MKSADGTLGEVVLVQAPFVLSRDFIDYPWLDLLASVQAASVLKDAGWKTRILNGLSGPGACFDVQGSKAWLGRSKSDFLDDIASIEEAVTIVHTGPWFAYSPSRQWMVEILHHLRKVTDSIIIVADLHQGAMHYVESDASFLFDAGADLVQRYEGERFCKNLEEVLWNFDRNGTSLLQEHDAFDICDISVPAWDLVNVREYFEFCDSVLRSSWRPGPYLPGANSLPLVTSRGCPYSCIFCSHGPGLKGAQRAMVRTVEIERIAAWLEEWKEDFDLQRVVVLDEVANLDMERFSSLLDLFESLELSVEFPNGLRADLLTRVHIEKLSGMTSKLKISLESAVERVQREIIGKNLDSSSVEKVAKVCQKHDLDLEVHGIIGIPGETASEIMMTLHFCDSLHEKFDVQPRIQFASPLAGTELYRLCLKNKDVLLDDSWDISVAFTKNPVISTADFDKVFLKRARNVFTSKMSESDHKKVIVNLTYRCNNRCIFCAVADRLAKDANVDQVMKKIARYRQIGFSLLDIDGGEPTMHSGLVRVLEGAKKMGFHRISLVTNARRASYPDFARRLVDTGVDEILISLHSSDQAIQEQITKVPGSFDQTIKGLQNFIDCIGDSNHISVNTTMVTANLSSLNSMGGFLRSIGVKRWNLQLVTPFGRADQSQLPSEQEIARTVSFIVSEFGKQIAINTVNIPPCKLPGLEHLAVADFEKANRQMVFVGEDGKNLQAFLASKRRQIEKCNSCPWSLICPGEYFF